MQVKSGQNEWIEFTKPYEPGADGGPDPGLRRGLWHSRPVLTTSTRTPSTRSLPTFAYTIPALLTPVISTTCGSTRPICYCRMAGPPACICLAMTRDLRTRPFSIQEVRREPSGRRVSVLVREGQPYLTVEHPGSQSGGQLRGSGAPNQLHVASIVCFEVSDTNAPSAETRFYRVRAQKTLTQAPARRGMPLTSPEVSRGSPRLWQLLQLFTAVPARRAQAGNLGLSNAQCPKAFRSCGVARSA